MNVDDDTEVGYPGLYFFKLKGLIEAQIWEIPETGEIFSTYEAYLERYETSVFRYQGLELNLYLVAITMTKCGLPSHVSSNALAHLMDRKYSLMQSPAT